MLKRDILESYSKFHNRKLLILEQEDEAGVVDPARLTLAVTELQSSIWADESQAKNRASFKATISGKDYFYSPGKRKVSGGKGVAFGSVGILDPAADVGLDGKLLFSTMGADPSKPNGVTNLKKLISSLIGDYAGGATAQKAQQQLEVGSLLTQVDNDTLSKKEKDAIIANLESIVQNLPAIWEGMSTDQKDAYGSIDDYQSKFAGSRRDSFEKKLLEDKISLTLKDGEWISSERPVDGYQSVHVSKSLSDLVRAAGASENSETTCSTVLKDFALQKGTNRIIISPKGEGTDRSRALSFSDPQRTLSNLLRKVTNKCNQGSTEDSDKKVRLVDVRAIAIHQDGKNENAVRGFMMEEILEVFSLLEIKRKIGKGVATGDLDTLIARKFSRVQDRLGRLKEEVETWVMAGKYSALSPEQAELIEQLKEVADGMENGILSVDKNSLFGSMLRHSRTCLADRKPDFVLPVGTETKRGKRQDVLEVYKTREQAERAASRMGVDLEPEEQYLSEALRDAPGIITDDNTPDRSLADILEDANVFERGQKVYSIKVSLKNYRKFEGHGAVLGGGRKNTMETLFTVSNGQFSEPFMQKIQEILNISDPTGFKEYADNISLITKAVDGIEGGRFLTTTGRVKIDRLQQLERTVNAELRRESLDTSTSARELSYILRQLRSQTTFSDTQDDANYSKARESVKRFLEDKKLFSDIDSDNEETRKFAQQYLATRMLHAGGSDDDNTLCDFRGLNTNDDIVFKQNDPLREAWGSIMSGDGKWELKRSTDRRGIPLENGGFSLTMPGTRVTIQFSYHINPSRRDGSVHHFLGQFETRLSKGALSYFNKLSKEDTKKAEGTMTEAFKHLMLALSLLQEKVSVVDQ